MIPHHLQAVQMAKMAQTQASLPAVKTLAEQIQAAQGPEIETMTQWLKGWGEAVPDQSMGGMTIMALADQHPELFGDQVTGVVLMSTSTGKMASLTFGLPGAVGPVSRRVRRCFAATIASTVRAL